MKSKPVLAVLGRSNTGKSSLCRMLAPQAWKTIKVGKNPGSTKGLIEVDNDDYTLVDLPGFGYMMHVSKKFRDETQDKIISFIEQQHEQIFLAIEVINIEMFRIAFDKYKDISVPFDKELFEFLLEYDIPVIVLANKIDKLRKQEAETEFTYLKSALDLQQHLGYPEENVMKFSAKTGLGFDTLKEQIMNYLESFSEQKP
ncbi:MAG TPA: GTPase [Candidatus Lokiarchaeia archaeon]|nr:GTPase [Candidatus Lokiarchaeia archaeon]